ncbi:MAG: hypothetical protein GY702_13625 [Desulfobulbaceae bacterium]|nr:hypothetical protein [Desulfobulbaceae bacterium]
MSNIIRRYQPVPAVTWVVEQHYIYLIHNQMQISQKLYYPEAALWDLLCRKRWKVMNRVLSALLNENQAFTAKWIETTCKLWQQQGWLQG